MTHELSFWDIATRSVFEFSSAPRLRDLYERGITKRITMIHQKVVRVFRRGPGNYDNDEVKVDG